LMIYRLPIAAISSFDALKSKKFAERTRTLVKTHVCGK
jgi:hypothetical protein